jgi:hypothetical protein
LQGRATNELEQIQARRLDRGLRHGAGEGVLRGKLGLSAEHHEGVTTDEKGISPRAGGGKVAWFKDPDGDTLAVEGG